MGGIVYLLFRYDVALLKLSRPVSYRDNILPICLPPQGKDYEGALGVVAGWGKTDTSFGELFILLYLYATSFLSIYKYITSVCIFFISLFLMNVEHNTLYKKKCFDSFSGKTGTNLLQKVYVPIMNNRICYAWHELKDIILELHEEMFCAGHEQGRMDACLVSYTSRQPQKL